MSIFKAFQKDRKIGTTPFSLNFQNILTANFGGLTPIGHFPVLPKDKFKIGTNILTKVEPMPAPAFTRIKQNQYAFFVPNAQTWKHWNDYVSNGTAYADTYGNNSNNQQTDNLWRPPQISVNQLQLISKIANGYSIPIFKFDFGIGIGAVLLNKLSEAEIKFLINNIHLGGSDSNTSKNVTQFFLVVLKKASQLNLIPEFITADVPYINAVFRGDITTPEFLALTPLKKLEYIFEQVYCEVGCDLITAYRLYSWYESVTTGLSGGVDDHIKVGYRTESNPNQRARDGESSRFFKVVSLRSFCDNISNDVSLKHSPFHLEKRSYCSPSTNNRPITYYVYVKNKYTDTVVNGDVGARFSQGSIHDQGYYNRRVRNCGYFWSVDCSKVSTSLDNNQEIFHPWYLNNYPFNPMPTNPDIDLAAFLGIDSPDLVVSDDLFLTMFNFKNQPNEMLYDISRNLSEPLPQFTDITGVCDNNAALLAHEVTPFTLYTGFNGNNMLGLQNYFQTNFRVWTNLYDSEIPLMFEPLVNASGMTQGLETTKLPIDVYFTYESYNLGFDSWSLLVYLCKNSCKLLDYFNIPLEGFTARSFDFYVGEYVKALPFMAYSKIWNDYFRNKVTSSPELDYREVNSVGCIDFAAYTFMHDCYNSGVSRENFPKWLGDKIADNESLQNGWCLPFSCAPKNALEDGELTVDGTTINISDVNHFHDLRCISWWSFLSVLTGWQLQSLVIHEITDFFAIQSAKLYGILAEKLYLPSYYNGLLHYKYQNFNKDYFSSALLDPMSGANQEEIGDTVNSLINAEAKQGFWNRLAQNRSVTQFWQSVFGVTPSHNDYDKPLMLGSAHTDVNVGEVVQLSQTDTTPQGQRSGLGSAHDSSGLFKHTFNEHGYIIILLSHTLELQYMQGLEKDWTPEESFLDLPFIDFVGLGNQSIQQKELNFTTKPKYYPSTSSMSFADNGTTFNWSQAIGYELLNKINNSYPSTPQMLYNHAYPLSTDQVLHANLANGSGFNLNDVFGYIPRYSTWKFKFDQCHGEFRNDLMFWHSFRKFFTQPILCHEFVNWEFMSENDELMRMFFVMDETTDKFKIDAFINATGVRPLPYVCTPKTSI